MEYRNYGELSGIPHVVVDGSGQDGTVLTLSHWPGTPTPEAYRADLSAEIAFRWLDAPDPSMDAAYVTNNHFDQDGLVGVFALVDPETALACRDRLIDIARAGDFSCFHERDSARAAIAIANLGARVEGDAYPELLPRLPELADHVDRFADAWRDEDAHITATEAAIADGTITITEDPALELAVVRVPDTWAARTVHRFSTTDEGAAHPYAVYNATDAFAILTVGAGAPELRYRYETWVRLTSRRPRPRVDLAPLAAALTAEEPGGATWTFDGVQSLSPALHTVGGAESGIDAERFVTLVTAALRTAVATWSPYD